uniref:InaF motif containing 2 n=1 Tax=Periophthalmus magnuspinnatus TaxID=409849 RepID=A0A3B4B5S5_9GOBI
MKERDGRAWDMRRRPSYPGELRDKQARRSTRIWVKVAMAVAYFMCVSVAAFVLVIYYVFFWKPSGTHHNSTSVSLSALDLCPLRMLSILESQLWPDRSRPESTGEPEQRPGEGRSQMRREGKTGFTSAIYW